MPKGLIIVDIPRSCIECPLCYESEMIPLGRFMLEEEHRCKLCPVNIENENLNTFLLWGGKPSWCPLKEIPEKKTRDYPEYDSYITGYDDGWDDCLDEILGE